MAYHHYLASDAVLEQEYQRMLRRNQSIYYMLRGLHRAIDDCNKRISYCQHHRFYREVQRVRKRRNCFLSMLYRLQVEYGANKDYMLEISLCNPDNDIRRHQSKIINDAYERAYAQNSK